MKISFLFLFILALIAGCTPAYDYRDISENPKRHEQGAEEKFHIHADFKVYIDDKAINFSVPMYQLRDKTVHVEDGVGEWIHVHKENITVGYFFETLGIEFNKTCITIPIEGKYCNTGNKKISFYVNDIENGEFGGYEIKNLDRILVSYGVVDINSQLESVTNLSLRS